jgi:Xaa-Pro aminopeptidase
MVISEAEKNRRVKVLNERIKRENLDALLVVGDTAKVSSKGVGSFRYLTDFMVYANYDLLLLFTDSKPVMLVASENTHYWASKRSWIADVRLSTQYPSDVVKIMTERVKREYGRLGLVSTGALPPNHFTYLQENLKNWQFVDADPGLLDLRFAKSEEEQRLLEKAGEIVDASFQAVQKVIKPGVKEYEIVGFLEGFHRGNGAEQTFNLISSGPFPGTRAQSFPTLPSSPSDREIKKGDVLCLEITAAYRGYWNQLVREVIVGKENRNLSSFVSALVKTVRAGVGSMKPGKKTRDFITSMEKCAEKEGFKLIQPMGHYVGLDLQEPQMSPEIQLALRPGTAGIVHPTLVDEKGTRVFWGETYIVGKKEPIRLNQTNDDLIII